MQLILSKGEPSKNLHKILQDLYKILEQSYMTMRGLVGDMKYLAENLAKLSLRFSLGWNI